MHTIASVDTAEATLPMPVPLQVQAPVAPLDDPLEVARFTRWEPSQAEDGQGARVGVSSLQPSQSQRGSCG